MDRRGNGSGDRLFLGVFQRAHGEPELAEQAFTKAVAVVPKSVEAHLNLANYYKAVRKAAQARKTLDSLVY